MLVVMGPGEETIAGTPFGPGFDAVSSNIPHQCRAISPMPTGAA
jgi:hypothetical protein